MGVGGASHSPPATGPPPAGIHGFVGVLAEEVSPNLSMDVGAASHSRVLLTLFFPQHPHPPASLRLWEVPSVAWVPEIWGGVVL